MVAASATTVGYSWGLWAEEALAARPLSFSGVVECVDAFGFWVLVGWNVGVRVSIVNVF